eukprot:CAMPEP_0178897088 /NCGR_PEP_ID=MMETSP0786-20121207/1547_1 /TAXON_ID=186022 /ORGANISM="Thalassionema frauenfeldii, Strain CCMP 1798" /LENGTH=182 /DNA_ID=CAMNT_0020567589 /DNA_START=70 /DNA_END=618 /DNA_ORIENTATION=-
MTNDASCELAEFHQIELASSELEKIRLGLDDIKNRSFPPACLSLLKNLNGNLRCIDCHVDNPQWATVTYGALLCLKCSGKHRSLGVQVSCVKSVTMDNWNHLELLAMLEGGNAQLKRFFDRHKLSTEYYEGGSEPITRENVTMLRYKTKAALFYREQLVQHATRVLNSGDYRGREASRRIEN